ncbi:MAG: DUF883 domain-containing protein [Verrucomicrobia bacterium]|nr:DUF883 domain-containing protein [Verrucomicrobiota bacterium]
MNKNSQAVSDDINALAQDARALLTDTAALTEDKMVEARKRLSAALESAKETCGRMQEKAIEGAKATDKVVREHPYQAVGVAFALGAVIGFLLSRRN